jgi:hypothetical protein
VYSALVVVPEKKAKYIHRINNNSWKTNEKVII